MLEHFNINQLKITEKKAISAQVLRLTRMQENVAEQKDAQQRCTSTFQFENHHGIAIEARYIFCLGKTCWHIMEKVHTQFKRVQPGQKIGIFPQYCCG
tara:strand:- start:480 stop:773 length:294 start_codon:yes stop_codon:yes gene_type:complete